MRYIKWPANRNLAHGRHSGMSHLSSVTSYVNFPVLPSRVEGTHLTKRETLSRIIMVSKLLQL